MTSQHLSHWLTLLKTGRSLPHRDKLILIHDTYVWLESTQQQKLFPRLQGISADQQAIGDDIFRKTCQAWIQLRHQLNQQYRLQLGCLKQAFLSIVYLSIVEEKMDSQEFFPAAARGVNGNSADFPRNPGTGTCAFLVTRLTNRKYLSKDTWTHGCRRPKCNKRS